MLTGGPVVDALWRQLLSRAGPRPGVPTIDEPDLHLLVDGRRVDGTARPNGVHVFRLPKPPVSVRIVSRAGISEELGATRDPRLLGVALRRIALWQGRSLRVIEADDPALTGGFHKFEPDNGFRWTDGDATLPAFMIDGLSGPSELELYVGCTALYPLFADAQSEAA